MTDIILSSDTIKVLKNFGQINQSLKVESGNIIRTLSISNIVLARAELKESFEVNWAIYDLPKFISVLEIFDNPSLNFGENKVVIRESGKDEKINFVYADPEIIHAPEQDITMPVTEVNFILKKIDLEKCLKCASALQSPHLVITNSDSPGKLNIIVEDVDNVLSYAFFAEIDMEEEVTEPFKFIFKIENLMIIPNDYNIGISSKLISHWSADDINYWIALESSSSFGV